MEMKCLPRGWIKSTPAHPVRLGIATSQRPNRSSMVSTKVSVEHHADPRKSKRGTFLGARSDCGKLTQRRSEGGLALAWKAQVKVGIRSESDALVRDRKLTLGLAAKLSFGYPVGCGALVGF
jgi:hypothetical protein